MIKIVYRALVHIYPDQGKGCIENENTIDRICNPDNRASYPCSLLDSITARRPLPQNAPRPRRHTSFLKQPFVMSTITFTNEKGFSVYLTPRGQLS
jgi:hypothetical protein